MTVVSNGNNGYSTTIDNNTFTVAAIYSLTNNTTTQISIVNPESTAVTGSATLSMFIGGHLTAKGTVAIAQVKPVYLGVTASTTSKVVGNNTQLTINIHRVNPYSH